jgi:hypothetical protein
MMIILGWMVACSTNEHPPVGPNIGTPAGDVMGVVAGMKHPPIPADSPAWRHDPGGFVPDFNFYGERNWDDVRMRVAGHIAVIERDRARLLASDGRFDEAARIYAELARTLTTMIPAEGGASVAIPSLARDAAQRDAELMKGMHTGAVPTSDTGVAGIRSHFLSHRRSGTLTVQVAIQMRSSLSSLAKQVEVPAIDGFDDFDDRHALRIRLWELYLDGVDPIQTHEPWGYFDGAARAADIAHLDAEIAIAAGLEPPKSAAVPVAFSVQGAGGMPTGDSLIDVAGQPGPKAIGQLAKLGLDDPAHYRWVEDTVFVLNSKLKENPGGVLSIVHTRTSHLDKMGHGSRYYNIKQLRNEAVRVLAQAGHPRVAIQVLQMNYPIHHQDWECPNREGILVAIEGRLSAQAGLQNAMARLTEARGLTDAYLAKVDSASR